MNMKEHILTALMEQYNRWEELVAGLSEGQILTRLSPSEWTPKDVLAHLMAWRLRSIARLEAAHAGTEPEFPRWVPELEPDTAADPDLTNDWLYKTYRDEPWSKIYRDWKDGFLRLMDLAENIPERDLLDESRYPWLGERPLALILISTYDHHQEHYDKLTDWMRLHPTQEGGQ